MRCHIVQVKAADGTMYGKRYAGTSKDARDTREEMVSRYRVKKKDIEIESHDVPLKKDELIEYLNMLMQDAENKDG